MSPVMVAPLVALAALLVMPGRLPERPTAAVAPVVSTQKTPEAAVGDPRARARAHVAWHAFRVVADAGARLASGVLHVP